ncbi:Protein LIN37 [Sesbania bispinosa]|nr:Protein LIN37 [Sesbania bispinosa]
MGLDPKLGTALPSNSKGKEANNDAFPYPVSSSGRGFIPPPPKPPSDTNGDRIREEIVRDRKVRITEDASLYALCRSWLRNGVTEESQPKQKDVMKLLLPKPFPASMVPDMSNKNEEKDDSENEENGESVEHLTPQELLKRHVKRAKKVRERFREKRLRRITRYSNRLQLLLRSPEQCKNDKAAGN